MIYYDQIGHMISDTSLEELHDFAIKKLNFKRSWFQSKFNLPHYDLTTTRAKNRAKAAGAIEIGPKELVRILYQAPYRA